MTISVFGKVTQNTNGTVLLAFFRTLLQKEIVYWIEAGYAASLKKVVEDWDTYVEPFIAQQEKELTESQVALSFGGDGAFLDSALHVVESGMPLLGVNFGRLGFLTTVTQDKLLDAVEELLKGAYKIEERAGLSVEASAGKLFEGANFALNELTIHKSNTNEMIRVHTYLNGEFLNSFWGDGLIVATPTGSTAYSLSCGGPIIHPRSETFVITPVAPHSLTLRPIVVPNDYVISFEIEARSGQAMIALDTRTKLVHERIEIAVRKADRPLRLIRAKEGNYLSSLRSRLIWGQDSRNRNSVQI